MGDPIRVALIVKQSPSTQLRETRNMGYWSYPVEEFVWTHFVPNSGVLNLDDYKEFDLVFQEDAGTFQVVRSDGSPPLVYLSIDSTLSEAHYDARWDRAKQADLILVDHDSLKRFRFPGRETLYWGYCVNDYLFHPADKTIDVNFHCGSGGSRGMPGGVERTELRQYLGELTLSRNWSYVSGGVGLDQYAYEMNRSRVVVNYPRTYLNRSHRILDALASGCCLVTGEFTDHQNFLSAGVHFKSFGTYAELKQVLAYLLYNDTWKQYADIGYELVKGKHTWETRAKELRQMLSKYLGL